MHRQEKQRLINSKLSMKLCNRRLLRLMKLQGYKQSLPLLKPKPLLRMNNVMQQRLVAELMLVMPLLEPRRRLLLQRPLPQKPLLS